jgi:hypothetical protein
MSSDAEIDSPGSKDPEHSKASAAEAATDMGVVRTMGPLAGSGPSQSSRAPVPQNDLQPSIASDAHSKPLDLWLFLGGVAAGIILYLLPKTQPLVIILLVLCFALLLHPLWNFWWIERHSWRRFASIIILVFALIFVGLASWPSGESAPNAINGFGSAVPIPSRQAASDASPSISVTSSSSSSPSPEVREPRAVQPAPSPANRIAQLGTAKNKSQTSNLLGRARQLYNRREFNAAIDLCNQVLSIEPNNVEATTLRAQILHTRNTLNNRND